MLVARKDSTPTALILSSFKTCWKWKQSAAACEVLDEHPASDGVGTVASTQSVLNVDTMLLSQSNCWPLCL